MENRQDDRRGDNRRSTDAAFESLRDAIFEMRLSQEKTISFLKSDSDDFRKWRKSVDGAIEGHSNQLHSHSNQLTVLKTLTAAGSAILSFFGVDRVMGK